jgi:hypothetical protein
MTTALAHGLISLVVFLVGLVLAYLRFGGGETGAADIGLD